MKRRAVFVGGVAAVAALGLAIGPRAVAVSPPSPGSGTHGCVLADVQGTPAPIAYPNSGTSQIGGNECDNMTVVATNDPPGGGEGYEAAAQTWSIVACIPGVDPTTGKPICTADPAHSYSSSAGSAPVATLGALPAGEQFTAKVTDGTLIVGTPNGVSGA